jgi:hypothetical protein
VVGQHPVRFLIPEPKQLKRDSGVACDDFFHISEVVVLLLTVLDEQAG